MRFYVYVHAYVYVSNLRKLPVEPNGGIFDVQSENDRAKLNVETPGVSESV